MASQNLIRALLGLSTATLGLQSFTLYNANEKLERNWEEAESRMDTLEGTLRGHIGIIEDSLERIEKTLDTKHGLGKGMSAKTEALYGGRGKDGNVGEQS
jgi:hypothetical protein